MILCGRQTISFCQKTAGTPYEKILDSLSTLAYLAPQTKTIKLGISSLIVAMRNPVVVAKQLASLDAFSGGGRVLLAMSAGWNEKEFSFLGSDFHSRGKRLDETIRLVRALWRGESDFESKSLPSFRDAVFEPNPSSKDITIWIGGTSEAAMRRAAERGMSGIQMPNRSRSFEK